MKKLVLCLSAMALLTTPAMAELADQAVPLDSSYWTATPIDGGRPYTSAAVYVYDNMWTAIGGPSPRTALAASVGGFITPSYISPGLTLLDDFQLVSPTFSVMHYIYWATGTAGVGSHSQIIAFLTDTGFGPGATIAAFSVSGLPMGGGWIISLTLPTVTAPSTAIWGGAIAFAGIDYPLGGPAGIGSHTPRCKFPVNGGGFITSFPGNLMWAIGGVPEPTTIGLLAFGGLLALRRRR